MTIAVLAGYMVAVLLVGGLSHRLLRNTSEDWFIATRSIGPFLLLMSLFGTNMTAFALLGASGESYHRGIGVFALMASSSAIVIPAVFLLVGTRLWVAGKRHGFLTQVQYFRARWGSDGFGLALFIVLVVLLVPYLLIGVMGGGLTLTQLTDGQVPQWVGGGLICIVVMTYVAWGGLRGTAWVNAFQTLVFMSLGALTFVIILQELGGLEAAMARVADAHPALLVRGAAIPKLKLLSYTFIPLSAGMFPHLFMHWLSARRIETFRMPIVAYPICIAIVWVPSVLIGTIGSVEFPGLVGPAANSILVQMIERHAPAALAGLLGAGVFAAIMSSLDSQVLALGTMFTQDVVRHHGFHDGMSEQQQIRSGRLFVAGILAATYGLSFVVDRSIFRLGVWSFTGFAALLPIAVAAVYWRRSTWQGATLALATTIVLWLTFFVRSWHEPGYSVGGTGLLPVVVIVAASALAMVLGSLFSRPPDEARVRRFF